MFDGAFVLDFGAAKPKEKKFYFERDMQRDTRFKKKDTVVEEHEKQRVEIEEILKGVDDEWLELRKLRDECDKCYEEYEEFLEAEK